MSDTVPAAPLVNDYYPDEIVLYGVKLNQGVNNPDLPFDQKRLCLEVKKNGKTMGEGSIVIAVIYGYGFEGHCYRFDRPKLMIFEHNRNDDAEGCGFAAPYKMWRIGSKRSLMELSTKVGLAEELILEANLPGNRAPNTYGNSMQMAHRSGRLGRDGGS